MGPISGSDGLINFLQNEAVRKKFHRFVCITHLGEQIYKRNYFHRQTLRAHPAMAAQGTQCVCVCDMFSGQPLVDCFEPKKQKKEKKESFLLSSSKWAQWNMAQRDLTPCWAVTRGAHIRQTLLRIPNLKAHAA